MFDGQKWTITYYPGFEYYDYESDDHSSTDPVELTQFKGDYQCPPVDQEYGWDRTSEIEFNLESFTDDFPGMS